MPFSSTQDAPVHKASSFPQLPEDRHVHHTHAQSTATRGVDLQSTSLDCQATESDNTGIILRVSRSAARDEYQYCTAGTDGNLNDVCFGCTGECADSTCTSKRSSKGSNADVESNVSQCASPVRSEQTIITKSKLQDDAAKNGNVYIPAQNGGNECDHMTENKHHVVFKELPAEVESIYIIEDRNQNRVTSPELAQTEAKTGFDDEDSQNGNNNNVHSITQPSLESGTRFSSRYPGKAIVASGDVGSSERARLWPQPTASLRLPRASGRSPKGRYRRAKRVHSDACIDDVTQRSRYAMTSSEDEHVMRCAYTSDDR